MSKLKKGLKAIVRFAFAHVKKDNSKVIFESYTDFTDNSRALYEYMLKNKLNEKYKFVWCVDNPEKFRNTAPKNVIFTSFRRKLFIPSYLYHIATAKTIFFTHALPPFSNNKTQTVVCLWHGIPLKMISFYSEDKSPSVYYSFLTSSGKFYNDVMTDCFEAKQNHFVITGFPRNDLLFQENDALERLGISRRGFDKVILWMPTYRQNALAHYSDSPPTENGLPLLSNRMMLIECNEKLRQLHQVLILKLHPMQDLNCIDVNNLSHIKLLTNQDLDNKGIMLYHLIGQADALLTDYSSIYLDYLLLNRPIGFIIDDIATYSENRGFTVDDPFSYMPGEQIDSKEKLFKFLKSCAANEDLYAAQRAWVCDQMHYYRDGNSSKRVTEEFLPKL